jgi:SAM-dependent MidA family methyltransferase
VELIPSRRPIPPFDPRDVPSDSVLVDRIRSEIESDGPMSFARFMELALTDPEHGYYATSADRPSRSGDFLTAPELHPIFGWTLARMLEEAWRLMDRPSPFLLREDGAGTGTLAVAILDGLARDGSDLRDAIRYRPRDVNPARERMALERVASAGHGSATDRVDLPLAGVSVANEFLDALPVHRVEVRGSQLVELLVGLDGDAFADVPGEPTTPALAARLAGESIELAEGQRAEIALGIDAWADGVAAELARGLVLVIDYGAPAAELYDPVRRPWGTLRAYVRQRVHDDPYRHIGRQDLTAHVDLSAVERALGGHDFERLGRTTQARFLVGAGLEGLLERVRSDPATDAPAWLALRSSVARLLDPRATGGFAVLGMGRGLEPETAFPGLGPD